MAILVTGGAGYIGSHTCAALLSAGEDVLLLDNFSNAKTDVVRRIELLSGRALPVLTTDLLHESAVRRIFCDHEIEAVVHFAGKKAVGESVYKPLLYYENNLTGTLHLLSAMAESGCKKIVFSSSATVYGMSQDVPFSEETVIGATNPYGRTKQVIEEILRDLYVSDGEWSIALLRYFNPIGAHKSGLIGEAPEGIPNNLLPYVAKVAAGKLPFLQVFGDDYDTPDGTGVRDYIHVEDLAAGHLAAMDWVRKNTGAEAVNLGTGRGYSVLEVVRAFEKACGKVVPHKIVPRRPGDIAACYADVKKAQSLFGWEAVRGLEEMCEDAWRFTRMNEKMT